MKRLFITSSITIALLLLATTGLRAQDELHQSYPLNERGTVSVTNISGFIHITGWSENRVQLDAVKRGNKEDFSLIEIQVSSSAERLEITTTAALTSRRMNRNVSVEYELKVPRSAILNSITTTSGDIRITEAGSRVTARSTSGIITVRGITGETNLNTTSGDISAEHISGSLTVRSTSGDVRVNDGGAKLSVIATSGDITALRINSDVSLVATSGDIRIEKAGGRVNAQATSGTVIVRNVAGDATLGSVSDSILAEDIKGRVTATAVSGDVTLRDIQEGARVTSVSGTINVTNTKGLIEAKTTSGDVIVHDVDSHEILLGSHSGSVSYNGTIYEDGRYGFESFSGSVTLTIPAQTSFSLSATTFNGSIETDFPITIPLGTRQTNRPKRLQGTHGNGGAQIKINGFNADIKLKKK